MESHPECGLVYSDRNQYVVESKKEMKDYLKNNGWEIADNPSIAEIISLQGVGTGTCTVMVRKNLIERIIESDPYLHQSDKFLMGDTQLWAELSVISNIAYIPESLATYRILPESASKTKNARKSLQWGRSFCDVRLYLCDKYNLPEDIRREIESLWCDCSLRLAFLEGNGKLALEVKMKKQRFTWKEWLRYLGAKYLVVNYLCRIAALSRNSFTRLVLGKRTG